MSDQPPITEEMLIADMTDKEISFCRFYVDHFNASKAARQAGYSEHSAGIIGHENLKKPKIQRYKEYLVKHMLDDAEISPERILRELAKVAFYDPADLYDDEGKLLHVKDLPPDVRAAITQVEHDTVGKVGEDKVQIINTKYRLDSRKAYVELLGKYQKMFAERRILEGDPDNPIRHSHGVSNEMKELMGEVYDSEDGE